MHRRFNLLAERDGRRLDRAKKGAAQAEAQTALKVEELVA